MTADNEADDALVEPLSAADAQALIRTIANGREGD